MILGFNAGVVDQDASISDNSAHCARAVLINFDQFFASLADNHQLCRLQLFLNAKNDTVVHPDSDGSGSEL
jgi:hypothetical protein